MTNLFLKVNKDLFSLGLTPIEILILAQIMEFNTNTGDCFISNQTLAAQFGVSEKTISRSVANLEGKGFITRNTENVQKGKERHMTADLAKIDAAAKDKLTLGSKTNESAKDKMTFPERTNCPFPKGQNDSIKYNSNKIKEEDNKEIDESAFRFAQAVSSISQEAQELEAISPEALIRMGARYEITSNDLIRIVDTGKLFRIKQ